MDLDLIVENATIVTAAETLAAGLSIGIKNGVISVIAQSISRTPNTRIIDAQGAYVTPGGVDSHVHLHQDNALAGDKWLSGSRSALAGGNTTIMAFATQKRTETSVLPAVEAYHQRASNQSFVDYGFHLILTNPTETVLNKELPVLVDQGITSLKLYMTYPDKKLGDRDMLESMMRTRALGMTTMIHAENSDMIDMVTQRLLQNEKTLPRYHAIARPQIVEDEATSRAISLATLTSTPILIVHMSTPTALSHARKAQSKSMLPVHAETCPHYLTLLSSQLANTVFPAHQHSDQPVDSHMEEDKWAGARHVCAPPLRHSESDLNSVWDAINNGTINVISSDHAPSSYNSPHGKCKPIYEAHTTNTVPTFTKIPNGLPGIETRLPILFDAATNPDTKPERRISLPKFVALTSTNPAKLYGLDGRKGSIAPGYDADLTIWYPSNHPHARTKITNEILHHSIDYTPFEGMEVCNWPRKTILRGQVAWDRDLELSEGYGKGIQGNAGDGQFLKRGKGQVLVGRVGVNPPGMREGERSDWDLNV